VPLPEGATRPPKTLRRPSELLPDLIEVFELFHDDDWDTEHLAGYVFVGTIES
jgi:hypothetical protein